VNLKSVAWGNIAVRNKARTLLEKSNALADGPVRMTRVLEIINLSYSEFNPDRETQSILGAISHSDGCIYINADEPAERKHMILSHEIGHALLHPAENHIDFKSATQEHLDDDEKLKEREANVFAYELALPYPEFAIIYKLYGGDEVKIAEHFLVSVVDVKKRIKFLQGQIDSKIIENFL